MKKLVSISLALSIICFCNIIDAQTIPSFQWQKSLGGSSDDQAKSVQQTSDGGFIVAGFSWSDNGNVMGNHGLYDYWVVKLNAKGHLVWQKSLGGSQSDLAWSIQQTKDGGFIVAGSSLSLDGDVSGNHGSSDYWVVKLNSEGDLVWQKSLGGSKDDEAFSIQQTTDGGFIVAGYAVSNDDDVSGNHGHYDYWVIKLDAGGNLMWQKALGGTKDDIAQSIQQTADGGFIVAGYSKSSDDDVSGNHGNYDYWVVKLDVAGNLVWQKSLGGSNDDEAYSVQQTTDGGFIVAGFSWSHNGDVSINLGEDDYWIVKLDPAGNLVWQKSLGGSSFDEASSVQQTTDGGFIVAGHTQSNDDDVSGNHGSFDYWIVKLDTDGNLVWQKPLGGSNVDVASSIQQTTNDGFIVAGYSYSSDGDVAGNHGIADYWIVKLTSDESSCSAPYGGYTTNITSNSAVVAWYDSSNAPLGYRIKVRTGSNWTHLNGSSLSKTLTGLSPNTTYVWQVATNCDTVHSDFSQSFQFTTLQEKESDIQNASGFNWSVFPNPASESITVEVTLQHEESVEINVLDMAGRKVYNEKELSMSGTFTEQLDLTSLPAGIYFISFTHNRQSEIKKLSIIHEDFKN